MKTHPTAIIHESVKPAEDVRVGPYCIIGRGVELGPGCVLESHVVVGGPSRFGARNRFFPYASVGLEPQDLKFHGEASRLEVGDDNTFREFVTVHRGTQDGGGVTHVGSHNLLMAYTHVAHDCALGSHIVMANGASLGGHVVIEDYAVLGAFCGIHQFNRIGRHSFIGAYTPVNRDVLPFSVTTEERQAEIFGVNAVGLERRGFEKKEIHRLRKVFRILTESGLNTSQALEQVEAQAEGFESVGQVVDFIRNSKRGFVK